GYDLPAGRAARRLDTAVAHRDRAAGPGPWPGPRRAGAGVGGHAGAAARRLDRPYPGGCVMSLRSTVYFAGWGGDSLGWEQVPGIQVALAANHNPVCVDVHALNFPAAEHLPPGDVEDIDLASLPYSELFWASPACPAWTDAKGKKRHFDRSNQYTLIADEQLGVVLEDPAESRSRALIEQIPRYLAAMAGRGTPVLGGVMENVIQCRRWDQWGRWL